MFSVIDILLPLMMFKMSITVLIHVSDLSGCYIHFSLSKISISSGKKINNHPQTTIRGYTVIITH